ncbi:hypothetical protein GEMRC1_013603 [Eukaryota sp. GEM-RC1]
MQRSEGQNKSRESLANHASCTELDSSSPSSSPVLHLYETQEPSSTQSSSTTPHMRTQNTDLNMNPPIRTSPDEDQQCSHLHDLSIIPSIRSSIASEPLLAPPPSIRLPCSVVVRVCLHLLSYLNKHPLRSVIGLCSDSIRPCCCAFFVMRNVGFVSNRFFRCVFDSCRMFIPQQKFQILHYFPNQFNSFCALFQVSLSNVHLKCDGDDFFHTLNWKTVPYSLNSITSMTLEFNLNYDFIYPMSPVYCSRLSELIVVINHADQLDLLAAGLWENDTVKSLHLKTEIRADLSSFSEALRVNSSLTYLNLGANYMATHNAVYLANTLVQNKSLRTLDLWVNIIDCEGCFHIGTMMQSNSTLQSVDLGCNVIRNQGVFHLSNALKNNTTLKSLSLWKNFINCHGAEVLADALLVNSGLRVLNLGDNQIETLGSYYLSDALKQNQTLLSLNLWNNKIDAAGVYYFEDALDYNSTVIVDIRSNQFKLSEINPQCNRRIRVS